MKSGIDPHPLMISYPFKLIHFLVIKGPLDSGIKGSFFLFKEIADSTVIPSQN